MNTAVAEAAPGDPPEPHLASASEADLDTLVRIEAQAHQHPWDRRHFEDCLQSGYAMRLLRNADHQVLGYFVAMQGVDEVHLLNITVAPDWQGQGVGRLLLDALGLWARARGAQWLWLEVRESNQRAQAVYRHCGWQPVGVRKGYYPSTNGQRETALVMSLKL